MLAIGSRFVDDRRLDPALPPHIAFTVDPAEVQASRGYAFYAASKAAATPALITCTIFDLLATCFNLLWLLGSAGSTTAWVEVGGASKSPSSPSFLLSPADCFPFYALRDSFILLHSFLHFLPAVRRAIDAGVHREKRKRWTNSPLQDQLRKRAFCTLLSFDRTISSMLLGPYTPVLSLSYPD
jgi:hypothetical protein